MSATPYWLATWSVSTVSKQPDDYGLMAMDPALNSRQGRVENLMATFKISYENGASVPVRRR